MLGFVVDRDRCLRDGLCQLACGRGVIHDDGQGGPEIPDDKASLCNACGHCSAVCPVHAITSPGSGGEEAVPIDSALTVEFAAAREFILSCRSIRKFREPEVAENEILELLDIARKAPSASNSQSLRWLVINGREKMRQFTKLTMEWFDTVVRNDPAMNGRYAVDSMMERYNAGHDPILRGAPNAVLALSDKGFAWGPVDASIALTYFCLSAHGRNIGSCWCGFGMRAAEAYAPVREFLKLDQNTTVHAMAFFGYPDIRYHALPPRKPLRVAWL